MSKSGRISEIAIEDPSTWMDRVFLTFDIDWAHDAVLSDTVDVVEAAGVRATWFVTHRSRVVDRIGPNPAFELGIHPNFNPLLQGDLTRATDCGAEIDAMLEIVPGCRSVRSHSVAQSGPIMRAFADRGLTHDTNDNIPEGAGMRLRPWRSSTGMVKAPYCWADEHAWSRQQSVDFRDIVNRIGLAIFDFHPIHVFLNTEAPSTYGTARPHLRDPKRLLGLRSESPLGARAALERLLEVAT